jgi:hypothetical protein
MSGLEPIEMSGLELSIVGIRALYCRGWSL